MVEPNIYRATATRLDPTGQNWSAPKLNELADVVEGKHPGGQRIQAIATEGASPLSDYKAIIRKVGTTYYAHNAATGALISSHTSDARVVISAAITAITIGKIFIKDAIYDMKSQLAVPSGIELIGESREGTILKSTPDLSTTQIRSNGGTVGNTNIVLANLTIDHINATGQNWDVVGVEPRTGGACIGFNRVSRSTIYNCRIKDGKIYTLFWETNPVDGYFNRDNIIANCIIEQTQTPVSAWDLLGGGYFSDSIFYNNTLRNAGGSGSFVLTRAERVIIANNICRDNRISGGISIESGRNCLVANNQCVNNFRTGIKMLHTPYGEYPFNNTIVGNICYNNGERGMELQGDGYLIASNICHSNGLAGIAIEGGKNLLIASNIIVNNGDNTETGNTAMRVGIRLVNVQRSFVTGNRCTDTRAVQADKTQLYGIVERNSTAYPEFAWDSGSNLITNNYLAGNATGALNLLATTAPTGETLSIIKDNKGYNPQGAATISLSGASSPFTYQNNDRVPELIYISGGTVSGVSKNGITCFTSTNCQIWLEPNESVTVTYSSAPTMVKDRK